MPPFSLPVAPTSESGSVKAWSEPVTIPTYHTAAPDQNPSFVEHRVYQGSSGRVYPLPCIDRVETEPRERPWRALHLENQYLRVMILPELGGRIHVGFDKTNGYDFFYRQNVIKPALVGLAGPWVSGGVEFNWPQHHRPSTCMPVDCTIEKRPDGSCIVWCSEHDPMSRMKGMHGVCLHPDRSYIELLVRLYNRTPFIQTFLWWANVATHVHEQYQSFFPPDSTHVADHAKRAITDFPLCQGVYYGVDYGTRARTGVPHEQLPARFVPTGDYPANNLTWYANIPVPTSYMIVGSQKDFLGGYDHRRQAGLVHVADHHIAPGKKQWTWGNHNFGYAWDRNLTDEDGPYIELMAGVFTDNQPDFSFLMPGETKSFSQYWYPIQQIGPPREANRDAALSVRSDAAGSISIGLAVTASRRGTVVELLQGDRVLQTWHCDVAPERPFLAQSTVRMESADTLALDSPQALAVRVRHHDRLLISCNLSTGMAAAEPMEPAVEPALPEAVSSSDELFLIGLHLYQYRHATRHAEDYWNEALRRDPEDVRCHNALGKWRLHRGEFAVAEHHFRRAIARATRWNPNPIDGEPFYNLGLALRYQGDDAGAYPAFYKATWSAAWRAPGFLALAELDCKQGKWDKALDHAGRSLIADGEQNNARSISAIALRRLGRDEEASEIIQECGRTDPLDHWSADLGGEFRADNQVLLDLAFQYLRCGLQEEARALLSHANLAANDGTVPIVLYLQGRQNEAMQSTPAYCFPSRLEELVLLEQVVADHPHDARAHYFLGNWLFDRGRHPEAIAHWEAAVEHESSNAIAWRNLAVGYFKAADQREKARQALDHAVAANAADARLLYERDQLWKRLAEPAPVRLQALHAAPHLVSQRDDLSVELINLYNQTGQPERAQAILGARHFQPWEGGEDLVLAQFVRTQLALARQALQAGKIAVARQLCQAALLPPRNLGEDWHLLANRSNVYFWLGRIAEADGDAPTSQTWWERAARSTGDFQDMSVRVFSEMTYYRALALQALGHHAAADQLLQDLLNYARNLERTEPKIDYFATSLPTMLLFPEDLAERNRITAWFLQAQALFGLHLEQQGEELRQSILKRDPSHAGASDLRQELDVCATFAQTLRA